MKGFVIETNNKTRYIILHNDVIESVVKYAPDTVICEEVVCCFWGENITKYEAICEKLAHLLSENLEDYKIKQDIDEEFSSTQELHDYLANAVDSFSVTIL